MPFFYTNSFFTSSHDSLSSLSIEEQIVLNLLDGAPDNYIIASKSFLLLTLIVNLAPRSIDFKIVSITVIISASGIIES